MLKGSYGNRETASDEGATDVQRNIHHTRRLITTRHEMNAITYCNEQIYITENTLLCSTSAR